MRKRQFGSTKIILNLGALILIFDCSVFKYETECAFDIFMFNVFYKENKRSIKNWLQLVVFDNTFFLEIKLQVRSKKRNLPLEFQKEIKIFKPSADLKIKDRPFFDDQNQGESNTNQPIDESHEPDNPDNDRKVK